MVTIIICLWPGTYKADCGCLHDMESSIPTASTQNTETKEYDHQDNEPYYIYLTNSILDNNLQKYITAMVEHIARVLEGPATQATSRVVTFIPERNGMK